MTDKSLATIETTMQALTFTSDEIGFIKEKYAPNSTDMEFKEFVALCQIHNANPLKKEVYFIKYGNKSSIVFSYHWLLTRAMSTGIYKGMTDPMYADVDGNWTTLWLDEKQMPIACKIGVFIKGIDRPTYATVYWKERAKQQAEWKNQPLHMLMKCAAVAALKLTIPDLSGIYIHEEMYQEEPGQWSKATEPTAEAAIKASRENKEVRDERNRFKNGDLRAAGDVELDAEQSKRIISLCKDLKIKGAGALKRINEILTSRDCEPVTGVKALDKHRAAIVITALTNEVSNLPDTEETGDPKLIDS